MSLDVRKAVSNNNKGADQAVYPLGLLSLFIIRFLERIVSKLATGEI